MTTSSWGEGYVVDIDYTHGYFRELAPSLLCFVGTLAGVKSVNLDRPYVYYELGCGNGLSLVLHAAASPHAQFIGVDFNPTHIHSAREFAQNCGVTNVSFLERSFGELENVDSPDADFMVLHGVWSWISEENRQHIIRFIRSRLQPGGYAYISYNSLPGAAQIAPLQRLLLEHAKLRGGDLDKQSQGAIDFALRLEKAGAQYFQVNPIAKARLNGFHRHDPRYLVHEYFNENWIPFYHAEVARDLDDAKLGYIGTVDFLDNFDQFVLTSDMVSLMSEIGNKTVAETVKDFARNQLFRKDVYVRGVPKATLAELEAILHSSRFCLARPRSFCKLKIKTLAGSLSLSEDAYVPVLDALSRKAMTFSELSKAPETSRLTSVGLRQAIFGMTALGNVLPALSIADEEPRRLSTDRYNSAVLRAANPETSSVILASPVLGAGVRLNIIDAQILLGPNNEADAIEHFYNAVCVSGKKLMKEGKPVETESELRDVINRQVRFFFGELRPWLFALGISGHSMNVGSL